MFTDGNKPSPRLLIAKVLRLSNFNVNFVLNGKKYINRIK